jgi:protein-S-isoprenylcysteine O-methyltransferase Ste14
MRLFRVGIFIGSIRCREISLERNIENEVVTTIRNEEKRLLGGLKGYDEYIRKIRFRLIPFIW